jgi:proline utilization trans-activator
MQRPFDNAPAAEASPENPDINIRNPLIEDKAWFVKDHTSTQPVYIGEAACTAFGTRLRQFLSGNEPVAPLPRSVYVEDAVLLPTPAPTFQLPNRIYADRLIKDALRFLGDDYHLLLRKTTGAKLDALYNSQCFDDQVFLCKIFAIFAMGGMYSNRRAKDSGIPGTEFFVHAMRLFQDIHIHEEATVSYIELLLVLVSP